MVLFGRLRHIDRIGSVGPQARFYQFGWFRRTVLSVRLGRDVRIDSVWSVGSIGTHIGRLGRHVQNVLVLTVGFARLT